MKKTELGTLPFDKMFVVDGQQELCHATGFEVRFESGEASWIEFEDHNGDLHYGR